MGSVGNLYQQSNVFTVVGRGLEVTDKAVKTLHL